MRTLIICDIQEMYSDWFNFNVHRFAKWLNRTRFDSYVILFNGRETCGNVTEEGMQDYYIYQLGISERIVYNATYYDKGCGEYFGLIEDYNVEEEEIITIGKWCYGRNKYSIASNRNLLSEEVYEIFSKYGFTYFSMNSSIIPIKQFSNTNISLIGGYSEQCLKEVELNLKILGTKYKRIEEFIY